MKGEGLQFGLSMLAGFAFWGGLIGGCTFLGVWLTDIIGPVLAFPVVGLVILIVFCILIELGYEGGG